MANKRTRTSSFGTTKRENHDSSSFYGRRIFSNFLEVGVEARNEKTEINEISNGWYNRLYCKSSESMEEVPDQSVALCLTSPPYNNGKEYDSDLTLDEYLSFISMVGKEVYRVLKPGGRYVLNVANQGRNPYIPLTAYFWTLHLDIGFYPLGEIIWVKGKGSSGSCTWGSWMSARNPRIRDVHEYLLVMGKGAYRTDKGVSTISRDEFLESTLSVWYIEPEKASRIGHPAPFPPELAERVIKLFSYQDDVVLDPFAGSGTTLVVAKKLGRRFVGYEIKQEYCSLCESRLG